MIDSASSYRDALEKRRTKARAEGLQRIPFMFDLEAAQKIDALGRQAAKLEDRLRELEDAADERNAEEATADDVRASGHDLSELGQAIISTRDELERVRAALEDAIAEAKSAQAQLIFRRATADEYEQLFIKHGGAKIDTDADASYAFHNALVSRCFLRLEMNGEDAGVGSWEQFVADAELSFGEVDPIRALVFANNRRGGNTVPF